MPYCKKSVSQKVGGRPEYRVNEDGSPGLKGRERSQEKVDSYKGDTSKLLDISGSRVVFENLEQVYRALDQVKANYDVVFFKDRFANPVPSGFRDLLLNVRMRNGHIIEFRLTTEPIEAIARLEHKVYEKVRTIEDRLVTENRAASVNGAS